MHRNKQKVAAAIPSYIPQLRLVRDGHGAVDRRQSYTDLARSVGFDCAELIREELLAFFAQQELPLFDLARVYKWLGNKGLEARVECWEWQPLREQDKVPFSWVCRASYKSGLSRWEYGFGEPNSIYRRVVPRHALEKAALIQRHLPGRVSFFVSKFVRINSKPDPFLLVRPSLPYPDERKESPRSAQEIFIIDCWDEPGF